MPDYRTMYDRDYIGHFDLPGGADLTLTIKRVIGGELTAMGGRKSKKPIVHFAQPVKPLICNKTNARTISAMYGNMTEAWAGKLVTLFVSTTRNPDGTGDVECIRVRPKIPNAAERSRVPAVREESQADDIEYVSAAPSTVPAQASPAASAPPPTAATLAAGATITEAQEGAILDLLTAHDVELKAFLLKADVKKIRDLRADRYDGAVAWIKRTQK